MMRENLSTSNFKNLLIIEGIVLMLLLLVPLAHFLGNAYEEAAAQNHVNAWNQRRFNEFYALPRNTLDIVFLGSSHSYCTFDPAIFNERLNISSFQLGMPLQHPDASYFTLREVLRYHMPQVVVMEVYWGVLRDDFDINQIDEFFKVFRNEELKREFIREFPLNERVKFHLPFIHRQKDFLTFANTTILNFAYERWGLTRTIRRRPGREFYRSLGYIYASYVMPEDEYIEIKNSNITSGRNWSMSRVQRQYLIRMARLAQEHDVQIVFVTAPISNVSFSRLSHYEYIHRTIAELAQEVGVSYIDFNLINQQTPLFSNEVFRDHGHLNHRGAVIASNYFATWLLDNGYIVLEEV